MPSLSVLAAATLFLHTQETSDFLGCCKKLSPLDIRLLSSRKWQKPMVCRKVGLKIVRSYSPSTGVFEGIK